MTKQAMRWARRVGVAALIGALTLIGSPAQASADMSLRFSAPTRTVIDLGPAGPSVGDITVTTGTIARTKGMKRPGSYATNQITVLVDTAENREVRKVDLSIALSNGEIFATGLITAAIGSPPAQKQRFAITGGTGAYAGITGTILHDAIVGPTDFTVVVRPTPSR
jgi:hypothetical protein